MASIGQLKLPDNNNYNLSVPFVIGTGDTAGIWSGKLTGLTAYYDGLLILYKPSVAGASTTTLNLNSIGAKTCYINNGTKLTTHFPVNQPILLTYSASQNSGCWMCVDNYWTNTTYSMTRDGESVKLTPSSGTVQSITLSSLINGLGEGTSPAQGNDYLVAQYAGGGTSTTSYHRRKVSNIVNGANVKAGLGTVSSTTTQFLNKKGEWSVPINTASLTITMSSGYTKSFCSGGKIDKLVGFTMGVSKTGNWTSGWHTVGYITEKPNVDIRLPLANTTQGGSNGFVMIFADTGKINLYTTLTGDQVLSFTANYMTT